MSKYYLTEAYGELYNPRRADETFYENLKFVDYLMQEEIEEVMESLLWEFMDYDNTLDESYSIIQNTFSDDILEEVLSEARMTPRQKEERAARVGAQRAATLKRIASEKATARRQERVAKVTGALKKAGQAVGKAATGVGSSATNAMRVGKAAAAGAYDRAKGLPGKAMAALKGVVRKGATAVGRKIEKSGEEARKKAQTAAAGADYSSSGRSSGGYSVVAASRARTAGIEAASKTGSKRKAIGRLLRAAGAMVGRAGRGSSENRARMTRDDLRSNNARRAAAAKSEVGEPFKGTSPERRYSTEKQEPVTRRHRRHGKVVPGARPSTPKPSGQKPKTELGLEKLEASGKKPAYNPASASRHAARRMGGRKLAPSTPLTPWNKGPDKSGKASTAPSTIQAERRKQIKLARQSQRNEEFELLAQYILEDFIAEGYADNYEDAFEILENLSEESILELTEMYLEG